MCGSWGTKKPDPEGSAVEQRTISEILCVCPRQLRQRQHFANCPEARRRLTRTESTAEFNGVVFARRLDSFVSAAGFWHGRARLCLIVQRVL